MQECIFCKIVNKEIPADIVYEDTEFIALRDINPQAKIHLLVIPKKHYKNILDTPAELRSKIIDLAIKLAKEYDLDKSGFRLVTNTNSDAGQTVFHLHFHILGGEKLSDKMG